jgi:hypothetical protein
MKQGPFALPLANSFEGAGVYALFYKGELPLYEGAKSPDATIPIYVGKAVPPGGRKGGVVQVQGATPLYKRIREHTTSIEATDLGIVNFLCRYLVVTPLWITMAERFLIEHYQPVWNIAGDGFGMHAPGKGRFEGEISWWDALHPGRPFAGTLRQTRTKEQAEAKVREFFETKRANPEAIAAMAAEAAEANAERDETS